MKKQLETSEIQTGACTFCGQIYQFETSGLAKEEDLNTWAVEKCDCSQAKDFIKKKKELEKAKEKIQQMLGSDIAGDVITRLLDMAVDSISEDKIDDMTINVGNGCKAKVSQNSKGCIKVERTDTRKLKYEQ